MTPLLVFAGDDGEHQEPIRKGWLSVFYGIAIDNRPAFVSSFVGQRGLLGHKGTPMSRIDYYEDGHAPAECREFFVTDRRMRDDDTFIPRPSFWNWRKVTLGLLGLWATCITLAILAVIVNSIVKGTP